MNYDDYKKGHKTPAYCGIPEKYNKNRWLCKICETGEYNPQIYGRTDSANVVLEKNIVKWIEPKFIVTPEIPEYFCIQMGFQHPTPPNMDELHELVREMLRMTWQKTGGEDERHTKRGDIPWKGNYERVRMSLLNNAIRIARSGVLEHINTDGPMPPAIISDKSKMKDRDRNEAIMRETFWGREIYPDVIKRLVDDMENKKTQLEETKLMLICEIVAIVLSGRLDTLENWPMPKYECSLEANKNA